MPWSHSTEERRRSEPSGYSIGEWTNGTGRRDEHTLGSPDIVCEWGILGSAMLETDVEISGDLVVDGTLYATMNSQTVTFTGSDFFG